jgi:hypothetical protein
MAWLLQPRECCVDLVQITVDQPNRAAGIEITSSDGLKLFAQHLPMLAELFDRLAIPELNVCVND